jgi:hypothetical protein
MLEIKEKLAQIEAKLRSLREERGRVVKLYEGARTAALASESDETLAALEAAKGALTEVEERIEGTSQEQVRLLKVLGDAEAGRPGFTSSVNGWHEAGHRLDIASGDLRVDLTGASLMQPMAQSGDADSGGGGTARLMSVRTPTERAASRTLLYPWALPQEPFPPGSAFAASDFTISFSQDELSGVERDVDETSTKADLPATVGLATPAARVFAITAHGIPQRVFDAESTVQALLEGEMRRKLDLELDQHVIDTIDGASPATGTPSGTGLIEKARRAVREHRALGSSPSVLAVSPGDSADLDLTTTGADDAYVFVVRASDGSPLWSLTVVECEAVPDGTAYLLDPGRLGVLLVGQGSIVVDPLTGLHQNTVRLRVEVEAVAHVRAAVGAYTFSL